MPGAPLHGITKNGLTSAQITAIASIDSKANQTSVTAMQSQIDQNNTNLMTIITERMPGKLTVSSTTPLNPTLYDIWYEI